MAVFYIPVVDDQIEVHTPDEFPERNYDWEQYPASAATHVVCRYNDKLVRVPIAKFISQYHKYDKLVFSGTQDTAILCASNGAIQIIADREVVIKGESTIKLMPQMEHTMQLTAAWTKSYRDIRTDPAGAGLSLYADGFIEHSMARLKEDIQPIVGSVNIVNSLSAKSYKIAGKYRYGMIAEENNIVSEYWSDPETGEAGYGINIMSVVGLLLDAVQKLQTKIEVLEMSVSALQKGVRP